MLRVMRMMAFLLFLVLAGCATGDPVEDSTAAGPESSPPTVTASPSMPAAPSPPPLPEAATRSDDAGQKAFIQHWIDLVNYACATGDTGPLRAVSYSGHEGNQRIWKEIDDLYANGGHIIGGEYYQAEESVRVPLDGDNATLATIFLARRSGEDIAKDGTRTGFPAEEAAATGIDLTWEEDGRWVMYGLVAI